MGVARLVIDAAMVMFVLSSFFGMDAAILGIFWDPLLVPIMFAISYESFLMAEESALLEIREPNKEDLVILIAVLVTLLLNYVFMPAIYARLDAYMNNPMAFGAYMDAVTAQFAYITLLIGFAFYIASLSTTTQGIKKR